MPEEFDAEYNEIKLGIESAELGFEVYLQDLWNNGIELKSENYPICPIKPVP